MAAKVALCPLRYSFTALFGVLAADWRARGKATYPCNQDVLGKAGVGIFDLDETELDPSFREVVNQVYELTLWHTSQHYVSDCLILLPAYLRWSAPSVHFPSQNPAGRR